MTFQQAICLCLLSLITACQVTPKDTAVQPAFTSQSQVWTATTLMATKELELTMEGTPKLVPSQLGLAMAFDGDGDRLLVQANPLYGARDFTIEALIFPEDVYPANAEPRFLHIESEDNPNRRVTMELRLTPTQQWYFDGYIKSEINNYTLVDPTLLHPIKQWSHVAITYQDGQFSSYVNGIHELRAQVQYQAIAERALTSLGARMNRVHWFNGQIAQVSFSHQALNPEQFVLLPLLAKFKTQ